MIRTLSLALTGSFALTAALAAETPEGAAARLDDFLDAVDPGPGYAVTVVTADDVLLQRATGVRRVSTGLPMTADTPIYIASQTKAYMGLLAARLDAEGVLALDSTLADHWPELDWPGDLDASAWTLRDLLTHQVPLESDLITTLEAYVTRVDPADYPRLVAATAELREPGFDYSNFGYNLYGAILETATGRTWQDWLDRAVFDPLGFTATSARTSDFDPADLGWSHTWTGDETGWAEVAPKTDGMMQSAGGLMTSPADMAAWLQLQLRGEGPVGSGITADMVANAQTSFVDTHQEDGRNAAELPCSGYSLGWNICDFEGHTLYVHGGGYTGARTMMAFSPDLGVGIAAFSNSDNMTGWLTSRTITMYLQFLVEHEDAERWREVRIEQYPQRIDWLLERRETDVADRRAEDRWGGWTWSPTREDLAAYTGRWGTGEPYLDLDIRLGEDGLVVQWGDLVAPLEPAVADRFAARTWVWGEFYDFRFERDDTGAVTRLVWDDETYSRLD